MQKAYSIEDDVIVLHRELTELDRFVKSFLDVLKKYSDYLVVSGFVSIATGRARGTEDVDIFMPIMEEMQFDSLFGSLQNKGFWCYQGDDSKGVYDHIKKMTSVRFARIGEMFPNIELVPIDRTRKAKYFEFTHPQKIRVKDFEFKVPPIEFEILYKEIVLGSEKDRADAHHLRAVFSEILNSERFKEYEAVIKMD